MYWFGTGFEQNSANLLGSGNQSGATISNSTFKTGAYALFLTGTVSRWLRVPTTIAAASELCVSCFINPSSCYNQAGYARIEAIMTDGGEVSVRLGTTNWDIYVNNALVASGSIEASSDWHNVKIHFLIHAVTGKVEVKVDGIDDATFTGNTVPTSDTTIAYVRFMKFNSGSSTYGMYVDDATITIGSEWPRALRYSAALVPNGDSAVQWTPSTGATNYNLVDEIPAATADYVSSTGSTGISHKDKYDMAAWDGTNKTPVFVTHWAYAQKEDADAHKLRFVFDDGAESSGSPQALATSWGYVYEIWTAPPGGGSWSDAIIDAILGGYESVFA